MSRDLRGRQVRLIPRVLDITRRGERMGYPEFVFVDPNDASTVYTGGAPPNPPDWYRTGIAKSCIMRSTDERRTWIELDNGMPKPMVGALQAMTQHIWNGGMMPAVGNATGEVYVSEDRGARWQLISDQVAPVANGDHHLPFLSQEERKKALAQHGL